MFKGSFFIVFTALLIFAACKKADQYPIEPVITFKSLTTTKDVQGYDVDASLEIEFTDGDGDVGLDDSQIDTYPYVGDSASNVFMLCSYDSSGTWVRLDSADDKGAIPVVTTAGSNRAIRGVIRKDQIGLLRKNYPWSPLHGNPIVNFPIRFDVYIYDRALHKSNVITTPAIFVTTQP